MIIKEVNFKISESYLFVSVGQLLWDCRVVEMTQFWCHLSGPLFIVKCCTGEWASARAGEVARRDCVCSPALLPSDWARIGDRSTRRTLCTESRQTKWLLTLPAVCNTHRAATCFSCSFSPVSLSCKFVQWFERQRGRERERKDARRYCSFKASHDDIAKLVAKVMNLRRHIGSKCPHRNQEKFWTQRRHFWIKLTSIRHKNCLN